MMSVAIVKLEDFLCTTKTCLNLNSSYNYIKNICFELSFLTFIPALYTKTGCSIGLGVNTCYQNNHDVPISMVMHLQISENIYILVQKKCVCQRHLIVLG